MIHTQDDLMNRFKNKINEINQILNACMENIKYNQIMLNQSAFYTVNLVSFMKNNLPTHPFPSNDLIFSKDREIKNFKFSS